VRITLRHFYDFGPDKALVGDDLVRPEAWDALRTQTAGVFAIPGTHEEFVRAAETRHEIESRAEAIHAWLEQQDIKTLASYGVGGASLEWWLHRLSPNRKLILSDYGVATVERLADVFPEADVEHHDLLHAHPLKADLQLFHRIDTEFSNREWRDILNRFRSVPILVVAADVLDVRRVVAELRRRPALRRATGTKAGFVRTRSALEALWRPTHEAEPLTMHDLPAWILTPR
jgi:hypothetical protein